MKNNGVRDESPSLRDIQDLIARLDDVNRKLAQPTRFAPRPADAEPAEATAS